MASMARFARTALFGGAAATGLAAYVQNQRSVTQCKDESAQQTRILIVGGGTGGLTVATQLLRDSRKPAGTSISVVEPSQLHMYQPMWTMVGGCLGFNRGDSVRPMSSVMPAGVNHIEDSVKEFNPAKNHVVLASGRKVDYDYMIVSTGLKMDWDKIQGLREAIDDPDSPVASTYDYSTVGKVQRIMTEFKGGEALFTQPACGIKCGGAPQKVMWLQETHFRQHLPPSACLKPGTVFAARPHRSLENFVRGGKLILASSAGNRGIREITNVRFHTNLPQMFHVKKYADNLDALAVQKNIDVSYKTNLIKVDKDKRVATFKHLDTGVVTQKPYDVLHVVPYMSPPEVVQKSPLANKETGFIEVDKHTLISTKFDNVFAIGDSSNLPTSKTAAAIASQAPVLVSNLFHKMKGEPLSASYDGYTACPIFTGDNKLMLCEFLYGLKVKETFPFDQGEPSILMYYVKTLVFPPVYWHAFIKGFWYGKDTFFYPSSAK